MLSGDISLMKGKSDDFAIVAANAVFPDPDGPWRRRDTRGVRIELRTCSTNNAPSCNMV